MVFDKYVFEALCDAQAGNNFKTSDVDTMYQSLLTSRNNSTTATGPTSNAATDRPFYSFGIGAAAGNDALTANNVKRGIENTLLRSTGFNTTAAATNQRLFDPYSTTTNTSPKVRYELLNKLFNNVTTRSNTFGVWVTVGFFQVMDDTTRPVKLGAEIGKTEGRNIRHRMFAIVDRTNLTVFKSQLARQLAPTAANAPPNQQFTALKLVQNYTDPATKLTWTANPAPFNNNNFQTQTITDPRSGLTYTMPPPASSPTQPPTGPMLVTFEPDTPNEETVSLNPGAAAAVTVTKTHPAGSVVISRGNPGPWTNTNYNPHLDQGVVLYFAVIE
jgi:hypothetical protein